MKSVRLFIAVALLLATFSVNAQNSRLDGQQYNVVMVDEANGGPEIHDVFSFSNNSMTAKNLSKDGFTAANVSEAGNDFEVTLSKSATETMDISGTVEGETIFGEIVSTANGQTVNYKFRGMTSAEWNKIREAKQQAGQ